MLVRLSKIQVIERFLRKFAKSAFFLLNSLNQRLANDIFLRVLFMKITISNFSTSTSSPWIFPHISDNITKLQKHIYFE